MMRALVSRATSPGFSGSARIVFAGTPSRLAVFSHAALCLADAIAAPDPAPNVPVPYPIATLRLGDDVDLELVALPLVPAYAPLWPMAISGSAIVVRLAWSFGVRWLRLLGERLLHLRQERPLWRSVALVAWSGMRGGDSLAPTLALPLVTAGGVPFPDRSLIVFLTFASSVCRATSPLACTVTTSLTPPASSTIS